MIQVKLTDFSSKSDPVPEKMFLGIRLALTRPELGGIMAYIHHKSDRVGVYGRWIRHANHWWLRRG